MADSKFERLIPNTLYEVIAYFGSGSIFITMVCVGLIDNKFLKDAYGILSKLEPHHEFLALAFLIMLIYAYGQLASTFSALFIAAPVGKVLKKIRNKSGKYKFKDFFLSLKEPVENLQLNKGLPVDKVSNKWTLMYYLQLKVPNIGNDILKRYAREKLARINAFNMLVIFTSSGLIKLSVKFNLDLCPELKPIFKVSGLWFFVLTFGLFVAYIYEYYKRKCWNNDLLVKVLPVTQFVESKLEKPADAS